MNFKFEKVKTRVLVYTKIPIVTAGLLILASLVYIPACTKSTESAMGNSNLCSGAPKTFSTDVSPIIQSTCATNSGCHGTGSTNGPGALTSYSQVFNARTAIRSAVISGEMPKNGTLTAGQKSSIICWIDNGAFNN